MVSFALIKGRMRVLRIIWDFMSYFHNLFQILKMNLQKSLVSLKVMLGAFDSIFTWNVFCESVLFKIFGLKTFYIITTKRTLTNLAWANIHLFVYKKNKIIYLNNVIKRLLKKKIVYEPSYFYRGWVFSMTWFPNQ